MHGVDIPVVDLQVVSHHEDLLSQATGIETLEGQYSFRPGPQYSGLLINASPG